jgi:hypothetical protein
MIKQAVICTAIVLAGAAPPVPQGRPHDGTGASVGPIRPAYHCEPVCAGARDPILLPPALAPVRSFGVEHVGQPVPVPAPPAGLIFVGAVLALAWLRRINPRRAAGSRPRGVLPVNLAARAAPGRRARRFFVRENG